MWKFPELMGDRTNVDPVEKEFFRESSDDRTPRNLVRESIQNSLDSQLGDQVRIRYTFGTLNPETTAEIYSDLTQHLQAKKSGLRNPPDVGETMRFLVIEDFGTTGLKGDPHQLIPDEGDDENDFFYFWRNVGRTGKSGSKLGSWGLGKTVFPASSEINSFFGLTTREDDSEVTYLMGLSVLKIHQVGSTSYDPYGHYAQHGSGFALPITDDSQVERFRRAFHLHRKRGEPGLSVMIPHVIEEFTIDLLKQVAIEHFFWPILAGRLSIEVQEDYLTPPETIIDASTLVEMCARGELERELSDTIALANLVLSGAPVVESSVHVGMTASAPKWGELEIPESTITRLRGAVHDWAAFTVNVDLPVRYEDGSFEVSRFSVLGQPVRYSVRRRSYFVRGGLFIERACPTNPSGYVFLVIVPEDDALARMLVAAENPSHTTFDNTDEIKQLYRHGAMTTIRFVRDAAAEIARLIESEEVVLDEDLFADVFWKAKKTDRVKPPPTPAPVPPTPIPPPVPSPRAYSVERTSGGFVVRGIDSTAAGIERISIKAAYDVIAGPDPIKNHQPWDFDFENLGTSNLEMTTEGCQVETVGVNEIHIVNILEGFRVQLSGFDRNRDLIVMPRARYL